VMSERRSFSTSEVRMPAAASSPNIVAYIFGRRPPGGPSFPAAQSSPRTSLSERMHGVQRGGFWPKTPAGGIS